jgi:heme A synthase
MVYGWVAGRRAEVIDDGSPDAGKGLPAKVHFVWTLAYAYLIYQFYFHIYVAMCLFDVVVALNV